MNSCRGLVLRPYTLFVVTAFPRVPFLAVSFVFPIHLVNIANRWLRTTRSGVLFGDQVLEPLVFHLELIHARLKECILVLCFFDSALQGLFALLLLDAKAGRGGSVAAAFVFLGSDTGSVLDVR